MARSRFPLSWFKSRRLWIAVAVFVVVLLSVPAVYYFWWYPNSWRGRFDRVQMGMTEDEVKAILGQPDDLSSDSSLGKPFYFEEWKMEDERVVMNRSSEQDLAWAYGVAYELERLMTINNEAHEKLREAMDQLHELGDSRRMESALVRKLFDENKKPPVRKWSGDDGYIYLEFDRQHRVCGKAWLGNRQPFDLFDFLKSRLPF